MKLLLIASMFLSVIFVSSAFAEDTPDWVKNTAGWWATDMISETEFVNAISFLENHGVINVDQTCIYKINYNFKNLDQKQLEQLCNNEYNLDYTKEITIKKTSEIQLNEQGFRGKTFTPEKPHNTYRIFLIGGSTIFNGDNLEDEIVSYHLQKKFDEQFSKEQIMLIKDKIREEMRTSGKLKK